MHFAESLSICLAMGRASNGDLRACVSFDNNLFFLQETNRRAYTGDSGPGVGEIFIAQKMNYASILIDVPNLFAPLKYGFLRFCENCNPVVCKFNCFDNHFDGPPGPQKYRFLRSGENCNPVVCK